jgi:hypothetical protein
MSMSKARGLLLLFAAAPFLFTSPAYAQIKAGDTEIGVFGIVSSDNEAETSSVTLGANGGQFLTDMLEIKGSFSITGISDANSNGTTIMFIGGGADLALGGAENKVVPYIGGLLNLTMLTISTDLYEATGVGATVDVHAGVKFFMTERAAVDLQLRQISGTVTVSDGTYEADQDINRTEFVVGINVYI